MITYLIVIVLGGHDVSKNFVKHESIRRLRALMEDNDDVDKMMSSAGYISLFQHFLNKYEKENINNIITLIKDGYSDENIILIINKKGEKVTMATKTKTTTKEDVVSKETMAFFDGETGMRVKTLGHPIVIDVDVDDECTDDTTINNPDNNHKTISVSNDVIEILAKLCNDTSMSNETIDKCIGVLKAQLSSKDMKKLKKKIVNRDESNEINDDPKDTSIDTDDKNDKNHNNSEESIPAMINGFRKFVDSFPTSDF